MHKGDEFIPPHTDAKTKLLSLIFYMPETIFDSSQGGGTNFWKIKENFLPWRNWGNKHILDEEQFLKFKEANKVFFACEYKPNKIIGFIKSDVSWHSVPKINFLENQRRRAFTINIRLPKTEINKKQL